MTLLDLNATALRMINIWRNAMSLPSYLSLSLSLSLSLFRSRCVVLLLVSPLEEEYNFRRLVKMGAEY